MTPSTPSTEKICSLPELLQRVVELYTGSRFILFRGQRCQDWGLTPKIARTNFRVRYAGPTPEIEEKIFGEFNRLAVPHMGPRMISSPWDQLALAQHHGLPTRLLDWSTNPMVGLWFAVEQPPEREQDAAVWAYEASEADFVKEEPSPFMIHRTVIFRPHHHDSRIVAQSGWFTAHRYQPESERFSSLERISARRPSLRKFVVPKQYFPSLRDDLARCGITRASLFPDLAGLCAHLTWHFSLQPDEQSYDASSSL